MADQKVNELSTSTPALTDYIMGMSGTAEYKALVSAVAKKIVEDYAGSTLAGSAQSVKSALDALNSTLTLITTKSGVYQQAAANAWEYTGLNITVPTGYKYIVRASQTWTSGKPVGLALNYTNASTSNMTFVVESVNEPVLYTPALFLDAGTWYLYTKRNAVGAANNTYTISGVAIKV